MITRIVINDNKATPGGLGYLSELKAFANGKEYNFHPGINLIVGANGCGKSTLLKIIKTYLLVYQRDCSWYSDATGWPPVIYPFRDSFSFAGKAKASPGKLGIDVYADYQRNTFCYVSENKGDDVFSFLQGWEMAGKSTGERYLEAYKFLFGYAFSKKAELYFDYSQATEFSERFPEFEIPDMGKYAKEHTVECADQWTFLLDEPDRNLDIVNAFKEALIPFRLVRSDIQVIGVLHNPLLIAELSKRPDVNIIELTPGYVKKVKNCVKKITKGL
jgi:hypothetical protein